MLQEFCLFQIYRKDANQLGDIGIDEGIILKQTLKK